MATGSDAEERLRVFLPVLEEARGVADAKDTTGLQALTWFTDNVVVAWPVTGFPVVDDEIATGMATLCATYLQLRLACGRFFTRGALVFGDVHMGDRVAFGSAIVDAVNLEKSTRYPRIALDERAVAVQRHALTYYSRPADAPQNRSLLVDPDGTVFVDYLGVYCDEEDDLQALHLWVSRHQAAIVAALADGPPEDAREKLDWLARYHNERCLARLRDPSRFLIDGFDPLVPKTLVEAFG